MAKVEDVVTLTAIDPIGPSLTCRLGDGSVQPTSENGWQFTQRPRRESFTEFMGYNGYTMVVPLMFGDAGGSKSIEPSLEILRGMGRNLVGPRQEPAVIRVDCPAIPLTWFEWVISSITSVTEYRNNDGSRYYAQMNITFLQWIPTDLVATKAPTSIAKKLVTATKGRAASSQITTAATSPGLNTSGLNNIGLGIDITAAQGSGNVAWPSNLKYTVKKGDTLETIAKVYLGSATRWKQIATLNGNIRDPKSIKVGQVLRLPTDANANSQQDIYGAQLGMSTSTW